ncbi:putative agmatine deiminase [Rubripirellula amarantea]|uniref:Putative agmatine deiminase n=1 Tax=Rubripirellula amarantea TaxID=2527999 RepID=A0A5C5WKQ0_9BACT|nr:agmatine deiminase family protein [Rubripirellula amarantea]TWT50611.1 putative agmatine deiminase [Rubripirellula amarantea]
MPSSVDNRVPADWEPVERVWLAWPHNRDTWPGSENGTPRFDRIELVYLDLIRKIAPHARVGVLASGNVAQRAAEMTQGIDAVDLFNVPTNDAWMRDYGPTFVASRSTGELHAVNWRYNAWGGKYPPWDDDDKAAARIAERLGMKCVSSRLTLEGGSVDFDGDHRMLTTPGCLLVDSRNPGWTKEQVCREIYEQLGVTEIVWVDGGGLDGDDTDGHIDQVARFIDKRNLVVAVADEDDPNHDGLRQNLKQLELWGASTYPQVTVHPLRIPPPRFIDSTRVPESYCNYLRLGRDQILMPSFGASTDDEAAEVLADVSGAQITRVDCRDLVWGLGSLHCCSREQPAVRPK